MNIRVLAYAKLNLSLEIRGLRDDGFHEIRSLVQTIDLADEIKIGLASDVRVSCSEWLNGPNIAERAVRALLKEKRTRAGVRVRIEKHIPMGAGLGGGSSDAAAVLAVVNELLPPSLPGGRLLELAESIGSDVPLFLTGGCMRLIGRGRPDQQWPARPESFVLLVPDISCSTRDVYDAWQSQDELVAEPMLGRNDLYPAALRLYPELGAYRNVMSEIGGLYSGMSGSGSAFFTAFSDRTEASLACEMLVGRKPGCRVYCCQPTESGFCRRGDDE